MPGLFAPSSQKQYENPEAGIVQGVCADIIDLGVVPGWEGKPTHKIDIVFQLDKLNSTGRRFLVSRRFTLSMHEKSQLRPFVETWRGKKFKSNEADKFDLLKLIGVNGMLMLVQNTSNQGKTFTNIHTVMALPKDQKPIEVQDYTRREKKQTVEDVAKSTNGAGAVGADEDLPF